MAYIKQGSVIGGKYRLDRALAQGGMGAVWVAQHLRLDSEVAIKFMDPSYVDSDDARARFEREAKSSALLKSPNVVQVYDYGLESDVPYIVMELLEGEDLDARLRREARLSISATARILNDACKALRRAHEVGLIHRDLKPANLFLTRQGDEVITKVLDFGIAKSIGGQFAGKATKTGVLVGSPYYMSPEQIRTGKQIDHRTDIWSLGVIAFECITGKMPFPGSEVGDVLVAICSDPILPPSQVAPGLGPEVDQFFLRALMRDPEQRFQSVREFADGLIALASSVEGAATQRASAMLSPFDNGGRVTAPEDIPFAKTAVQEDSRTPAAISSPLHAGVSAVTAPGGGALPLSPAGTLSPAGSSLVMHPNRSAARKGLVIAAGVLVVGLGVAGVALMPSQERQVAPNQATSASASPALSAPPVPPPPPPAAVTAVPSAVPVEPASSAPAPAASFPPNGKKRWPPTKASADASATPSATPAASASSAPATPSASASAGSPLKSPHLRTAPAASGAPVAPSTAPSGPPRARN